MTQSGPRQPIRFVTPMSIAGPINIPGSLVQRPSLLTTANSLSTVTVSSMSNTPTTSTPQPKVVAASKAKPKPRTPSAPKEKKISTSLREDDDINDVAAMGGVNLQEESQRMAASANEVGVQIRSCKDESFLFTSGLTSRINRIGKSLYFSGYRLYACWASPVDGVRRARPSVTRPDILPLVHLEMLTNLLLSNVFFFFL